MQHLEVFLLLNFHEKPEFQYYLSLKLVYVCSASQKKGEHMSDYQRYWFTSLNPRTNLICNFQILIRDL